MQFTQVKADTFETVQLNAGIIVDEFTPATGVIGNILAASTGGFSFNSNPTFNDFGEDVDNCPANTWQMKRLTSYDPALSGTFIAITPALARDLVAAGTVSDTSHIVPSHELKETDFKDVWIVGDYSDKNSGAASAGFMAIHLENALNTGGLQWTTTKDGKGQFAFDFHAHYDYTNPDEAPFEIWVKAGTNPPGV